MADSIEVVGLVDGELMSNAEATGAREVVLALPLSRLIVRMVRVPAEREDDVAGYLTPLLQELSPYPDEPLTVGWETVRESERGRIVLAAALPESSADDIGELLDAKKLNVTRIDALVLGELRALWPSLAPGGELGAVRRLVLIPVHDGLEMIVLDGDMPSSIRFVHTGADLRREAMLSLIEAEDFGGVRPLVEVVTAGEADASALAVLAPARPIASVSVQEALDAVSARSEDPSSLDARPASWCELLEETRFKAKLVRGASVAVGVWLLVMGVLFGVPMAYGYMTAYQKDLSKRHQRAYRQVCDMKEKADLVREYSDRTRGALEMMKAVSDHLAPAGIELDSWDFKRGEGLSVSGVADDTDLVYALKNSLTGLRDSNDNPVFGQVTLGRTSAKTVRVGGTPQVRQSFRIECRYRGEEETE